MLNPAVNSAPTAACRPWHRRWSIRLGLLAGLFLVAVGAFALGIHPFLAVNAPVSARVLVVEGWVPDYAMEEAVREFRRGRYERLFTTGGPLEGGSALAAYRNYAELAAANLATLGLGTNRVTAVPSSVAHRNRTFGAAVALRDYWKAQGGNVEALNLLTVGAHARRSRLCFRRALGPGVTVGVLAVEDRDYDPRRWWGFSEGLKTTLGEPIGLLYAWLAVDYGK
jgi:hypothetical protein